MKWQGRKSSTNVNDQRGRSFGTGGRVALGGGGLGVVGLVIYLLVSVLGGGGDVGDILGSVLSPGTVQTSTQEQGTYTETAQEKELMGFLSVALADIEDTWAEVLPASEYRAQYQAPEMTIYTGQINTACGAASSGVGPFYCPGDQTIYLDLSFYDTLTRKYGAAQGDYTMVYVIAHEAGHHVQTLLGITEQLNGLRRRVSAGTMSET